MAATSDGRSTVTGRATGDADRWLELITRPPLAGRVEYRDVSIIDASEPKRLDISVQVPPVEARRLFAMHGPSASLPTVAATLPFDFVLSPVSPNTSFPAEWAYPTNNVEQAMDHIGFTVPFSMSEQPAISVGCGYDQNGVPIGLQIAGRRFDDLGVLQMARAFEQMRPAQRPWPTCTQGR